MQTLAAYLLETPSLTPDALSERLALTRQSLSQWLKDKGADDADAGNGQFHSKTGDGSGHFVRVSHQAAGGTLERIRLEERTRAGQIFTTQVTVVAQASVLRIHCSMGAANAASVVAPLPVDPRCPSIIRALLAQASDWQLNGAALPEPKPEYLAGETGGSALAADISHPARSTPIVVVSEIEGAQIWPDLADDLAYDLAGLARVVRIDEAAAWALSDQLGKVNSCYRGAVRLYWPSRPQAGKPQLNSFVWTASVLASSDHEGKGRNRLRSTLRRMLMSTAALSIALPAAVRDIEDAVARARIEEIEKRAAPDSEELAIARLYIAENQDLKDTISQLEQELARTVARAEAAEYSLGQLKALPLDDAEQNGSSAEQSDEPQPGEVRYYKKVHAKNAYDVLVEVDSCGHNAWQNSAKAEKAKKGLERLTQRNDWKNLQHCGRCTGGGMWKVRW